MKLIKKNSNEKGFTLVELVIVIAILAILALILVPAVSKYVGNADKAKNEASIRTIYSSAITEVATDPSIIDANGTEVTAAGITLIKEASNLKGSDPITVNVLNGNVESVTYTVKGVVYSFNGQEVTTGDNSVEGQDQKNQITIIK